MLTKLKQNELSKLLFNKLLKKHDYKAYIKRGQACSDKII